MKNKYDSAVVFLYATGNEKLLPSEFRKKIPYTTISTWRRTDYSKYLGHEFRYFFDEAFENADLRYKCREMRNGILSMAKAWHSVSDIVLPALLDTKGDKLHQKRILSAIGHMKNCIGKPKALKMANISQTLYHQWLLEARFDCFDSFTALCAKRHPHQLELKEVEKIKRKLLSPDWEHWPVVSIAAGSFRDKSIVASLCSWYKYARIFGIRRKLVRKEKKRVGLVSTCPNEYLHVDTTYYPMLDGSNILITFVMDNYSRRILGWHVAKELNFALVKEALRKAVKIIMTHPDQEKSILVADGGKENHNKQIDSFISKLSGHKMTKIRALKDIRFSNSPVEAIHKIMKGWYLQNKKFETQKALELFLEWAVHDYNMIRPHTYHRPRTPNEVYFKIPLDFDVKQRAKKAVQDRVKQNKLVKCIQCKGYNKTKICSDSGTCQK